MKIKRSIPDILGQASMQNSELKSKTKQVLDGQIHSSGEGELINFFVVPGIKLELAREVPLCYIPGS